MDQSQKMAGPVPSQQIRDRKSRPVPDSVHRPLMKMFEESSLSLRISLWGIYGVVCRAIACSGRDQKRRSRETFCYRVTVTYSISQLQSYFHLGSLVSLHWALFFISLRVEETTIIGPTQSKFKPYLPYHSHTIP